MRSINHPPFSTSRRLTRTTLFVVLVAQMVGVVPVCASHSPDGDRIAFTHVNVVPMDSERILENYTVIVEGTRIVAIGPSGDIEIANDTKIVDGSGRYLMPGLAEMHGHLPTTNWSNYSEELVANTLFLYVAGGVTTVRGMLGGEGQLELQAKAARGEIVSPSLYLAGPVLHGNTVASPEEAREKVRAAKQQGWDLLKVHEALTADEYDAIAETAAEVGIRFGGHVTDNVDLLHAIASGQETFDHTDGYLDYVYDEDEVIDEGRLALAVERTKEAAAWVVPTLSLLGSVWSLTDIEQLRAYPELEYVPKTTVENWIAQYHDTRNGDEWSREKFNRYYEDTERVLSAVHRSGAGILLGSDAPQRFSVPGFSLQHEMAAMVEVGMTPYEIYRTGTVNPGIYFQRHDSFGTIAVGRRADLVLLNSNPLESVENFGDKAGVMVRGRWHPWSEIQERLDTLAASYSE